MSLVYAHLNRLIRRTSAGVLFVAGPGHGGPAVVAVPSGFVVAAAVFALSVYATAVGGHTGNATRTASVLTLSLTGLWILAVISRPLNLRRAAIIAAKYLGLAFVLSVPLLQDLFGLEWPPNDLLLAGLGSAIGGILAIEALHRFQGRRNTRK